MHDIFINTCYDNLSRKPFSIGENVSITIQLVKRQSCHHTETSQLICRANQLTGSYMMATSVSNELIAISSTQFLKYLNYHAESYDFLLQIRSSFWKIFGNIIH